MTKIILEHVSYKAGHHSTRGLEIDKAWSLLSLVRSTQGRPRRRGGQATIESIIRSSKKHKEQ